MYKKIMVILPVVMILTGCHAKKECEMTEKIDFEKELRRDVAFLINDSTVMRLVANVESPEITVVRPCDSMKIVIKGRRAQVDVNNQRRIETKSIKRDSVVTHAAGTLSITQSESKERRRFPVKCLSIIPVLALMAAVIILCKLKLKK